MPSVSIIVPVFNVEKYIGKCLQSIISQTFEDWEAVLIDDGSTDQSVDVILSIQAKYKEARIHLFRQENQGVSVARNTGLQHTQGRYIQFVDADDWLAPDFLQQMVASLEANNADLSVCRIKEIYENGAPDFIKPAYLTGVQPATAFASAIIKDQEDGFVWRCLLRKEVIAAHHLSFMKDMPVFEDMLFLLEYLAVSGTAYFTSDVYYCYWKNAQSSLARFNPKIVNLPQLFGRIAQLLPAQQDLQKAFVNKKVSNVVWIIGVNAAMCTYRKAKPLLQAGKQCISSSEMKYINPKRIGKKKYLQLLLLKYCPYLFWKSFSS